MLSKDFKFDYHAAVFFWVLFINDVTHFVYTSRVGWIMSLKYYKSIVLKLDGHKRKNLPFSKVEHHKKGDFYIF